MEQSTRPASPPESRIPDPSPLRSPHLPTSSPRAKPPAALHPEPPSRGGDAVAGVLLLRRAGPPQHRSAPYSSLPSGPRGREFEAYHCGVVCGAGGTKYATTAETLTQREPDSMLAAMFSGRHTLPHHPTTVRSQGEPKPNNALVFRLVLVIAGSNLGWS